MIMRRQNEMARVPVGIDRDLGARFPQTILVLIVIDPNAVDAKGWVNEDVQVLPPSSDAARRIP